MHSQLTELYRRHHRYENRRAVTGPAFGFLGGSRGQRLTEGPGEKFPTILGVTEIMEIRKMYFTFFKLIWMCGTE